MSTEGAPDAGSFDCLEFSGLAPVIPAKAGIQGKPCVQRPAPGLASFLLKEPIYIGQLKCPASNTRKTRPLRQRNPFATVLLSSLIYSHAPNHERSRVFGPALNTAESSNKGATSGHNLAAAAGHLKRGGVVAIPTDTLYGLAADSFNADAIERVFAVKERPEGMALPVLLADADQLPLVVAEVPYEASALAAKYWPGSLTLIMERHPSLPPRLTAGGSTVAVRVPGHPVPRKLARQLGRPITGTSANISGWADPATIEELRAQLGGRVDAIVDEGPAPAGTASTIVDLTGGAPKLVREGAIPFPDIAALLDTL